MRHTASLESLQGIPAQDKWLASWPEEPSEKWAGRWMPGPTLGTETPYAGVGVTFLHLGRWESWWTPHPMCHPLGSCRNKSQFLLVCLAWLFPSTLAHWDTTGALHPVWDSGRSTGKLGRPQGAVVGQQLGQWQEERWGSLDWFSTLPWPKGCRGDEVRLLDVQSRRGGSCHGL